MEFVFACPPWKQLSIVLVQVEILNLIPWPGPQVTSMASTFLDPFTMEMQSSPSTNKTKASKSNERSELPIIQLFFFSWFTCCDNRFNDLNIFWAGRMNSSVLGLVCGEVTTILKASIFTDCSILTCISWEFCTLRPYTFKLSHWTKDTACKPKVFYKKGCLHLI